MTPSSPTSDQFLDDCSARLWAAEVACTPTALLSSSHPELDVSDAYAIQAATLRRRGMPAVGFKLGYTSAAMRAQMNIDQPNFGVLTEAHRLGVDGHTIDRGRLIHPRVEPEIALRLGRELAGAGHDRASVSRHLDAVMPALEVVDTRYPDYRFTLVDNIADNSSSAGFVTGPALPWQEGFDLGAVEVELRIDGQTVDRGRGADAMGDPLLALAWLAGFLAERGLAVPAGAVVLTGGLTRAQPAERGQFVEAGFGWLGRVQARFG
ncbi:2-keto-4-pentenoate hydratase [Methylibium petroleiphilum]|uniref:4-oxalocrotonate decarboxylase n=1 Tax=Methylibium petroleiphilum (strain ATCC BAA-1232 / LMG 22953 / PM1) TaxID=420662 RepID=A2SHP2_METPP|nr:fumarylacetoacetate hydrolase family protein [Methylibium petroleiphilum]ABM95081.1 4-oxalocrotonate decarboxylase [Methylibium petroleiphilum PM1]